VTALAFPGFIRKSSLGVRVRHRGLMKLLMVFPERRLADCCAYAAVRVRRRILAERARGAVLLCDLLTLCGA